MKATPKTDECIRMLKMAQHVLNPFFYTGKENFKKDKIFDFQKGVRDMICFRLIPIRVIPMQYNEDKEGLKEFMKSHENEDNIESLWCVMKEYQLVTANDLKNEFWDICHNIESMPSFLNAMRVKFEEVNHNYDTNPYKVKEKYNGINTAVELGKITKEEAGNMFFNILFITVRYDHIIHSINKIYAKLKKMAEPQQAVNEPKQTVIQENPIRQFTDEQIELLKSYFVASFKGMGNNMNYFDESLLIDLKKIRKGIEYAKIAKLIYQSPKAVSRFKKEPFNQWYATFCSLMGIEKCKYKISQIPIDDKIKGEFYYLT